MIRYKHDIDWFQKVYLVTDPEQLPWILTAIELNPNGAIFTLTRLSESVAAYDGEFTTEINMETKLM